jgi:hypothetical protein
MPAVTIAAVLAAPLKSLVVPVVVVLVVFHAKFVVNVYPVPVAPVALGATINAWVGLSSAVWLMYPAK